MQRVTISCCGQVYIFCGKHTTRYYNLLVFSKFYNIRFSFVTGAYRQFTFSFVDTEEDSFLIDRQSGIVTLNGVLDREIRSEYNLTVKVSDVSQTGGHFTLGNLIIDVLDENDNEPMFEHDLYNATIAENVEVGTVILTVRALSADEGLNALVTYAIDSGNEHGKFEIDGTTGKGLRICSVYID